MKVTLKMIHKDLKFLGFIMRLFAMISKGSKESFIKLNEQMKNQKGKKLKGFYNEERWINSRDNNLQIRVRIYKSNPLKKDVPGVLYLHSGGYAIGTPEQEHFLIKEFLNKRDCVIIAPDYRLSTETPYPAALNDSYDTLKWMKDNAKNLGIRMDQLIIYGGSAGGGLTSALTLQARDTKGINIAFQIPQCPMLDDRMQTKSMRDNNAPLWTEHLNQIAWEMYLKDVDSNNVPYYAAPARCNDLKGLPPTFSLVGDLDPFCDEAIDYFERLKKSGVHVEYRVFKGCFHGFEILRKRGVSKIARDYILDKFSYGIDNFYSEQE